MNKNNIEVSEMKVPIIKLEGKTENFVVNEGEGSVFDMTLIAKWKEAEDNGIFRYKLNIEDSKVLEGRYQFFLQLNRDRGAKRRRPQEIASMGQPFDATRFNFSQLGPHEIILRLSDVSDVSVNVSPMELGHSMLLVDRLKCLPQVATEKSIGKALEIFLLSHSPYIRMAFNSLCALASVNHLHWHVYYLKKKMLLESIDLEAFVGAVKVLQDYPAAGFCVESSNVGELTKLSFLIVNRLQTLNVAHNVYITRGRTKSGECRGLRIYIWPRRNSNAKEYTAFLPAVCELFGHCVISNKEAFESMTEDQVSRELREITEETFSSVIEDLRELITNETKKLS